jgi:hypothetical protein
MISIVAAVIPTGSVASAQTCGRYIPVRTGRPDGI